MAQRNPYQHLNDGGQTYIDVRPNYPEELLDLLQIDQRTKVADIGAGTGKLTTQLLARTAQVWAVEPAVEIAAGFFRVLPAFPRTQFQLATGENTGLPRREFDLMTFGQCWHWLDAPAASREAARILRPHGRIAIFFNQLDVSQPWVLQLTRIMRSGDVQKVSKPPQLTRDFAKPELHLANWVDSLSVEEIFKLGETRASWINSTPDNRRRMRENLRWYLCEELGYGTAELVSLPYQSQLWIAEKRY